MITRPNLFELSQNAFVKYTGEKNLSLSQMEDGLVSLFNGIWTFVGYLMPKLFSKKNSSGTI